MRAVGHGLVGHTRRPRGRHRLGELAVAGEVEVSEHELPLAHQRVFRLYRLLHLYYHLGRGIHVLYRRQYRSPGRPVGIIVESAAEAGTLLHIQLMAVA